MSRLIIEPIDLYWVSADDPRGDLCAHGGVRVSFDREVILSADDLSVSAGALYLLRTLEHDHLPGARDFLLPHCAHMMFVEDGVVVNISSCNSGADWRVKHVDSHVELRFPDMRTLRISKEQWRQAVYGFSATVRAFFFAGKKAPGAEDLEWYPSFCAEWDRRHQLAGKSS